MFFTFINQGVVIDTIDTLFLCFAIDKDNGIDRKNDELVDLVKSNPLFKETGSSHSQNDGDKEENNNHAGYDEVMPCFPVPLKQEDSNEASNEMAGIHETSNLSKQVVLTETYNHHAWIVGLDDGKKCVVVQIAEVDI